MENSRERALAIVSVTFGQCSVIATESKAVLENCIRFISDCWDRHGHVALRAWIGKAMCSELNGLFFGSLGEKNTERNTDD